MSRNQVFEDKVKEIIIHLDWDKISTQETGVLLNSLIALYRSTQDKQYANDVLAVLDSKVNENGDLVFTGSEEGQAAYLLGNACFFGIEQTKDEKYTKAVQILAGQLAQQPRNEFGVFVQGENQEANVLKDSYFTQIFYMNYETSLGGKEHYNDIIAQFRSIREHGYDSCTDFGDLALYACALIDTMEVMEQPIYEIYRGLQTLLKEAVQRLIGALQREEKSNPELKSGLDQVTTQVFAAYAIFKACRMKALQTERYESFANAIFEKALQSWNASSASEEKEIEMVAAFIFAYAESLRNRQYQDYGREKGGKLWS